MTATFGSLPMERERPFDPPAALEALRDTEKVARVVSPDGQDSWVVTDYATVRSVLADPRFSNRLPQAADPGVFLRMDPPAHTRLRRILTGQFTVHRMRRLEPRVHEIVTAHLDAMAAAGPPADLVEAFALPVPSMTIFELLGVPYADREVFHANAAAMLRPDNAKDAGKAAGVAIKDYLRQLVAARRKTVLTTGEGGLIDDLLADGGLDDEEVAGVARLLVVAGHETTANMLGLGTYALLSRPHQLAKLHANPGLITGAVEELLRYLTVVQLGTPRTALEDVDLAGHRIKAGQRIVLSLPAANRDPSRFASPDTLDVTASASGHLAFGHGVHQCLGQQLARIELRIGFRELITRFPKLALVSEQVPLRTEAAILGVHELEVTW